MKIVTVQIDPKQAYRHLGSLVLIFVAVILQLSDKVDMLRDVVPANYISVICTLGVLAHIFKQIYPELEAEFSSFAETTQTVSQTVSTVVQPAKEIQDEKVSDPLL